MPIQDYVNVVLKRWWVIVLAALTAAVVAYGVSKTRTPIFRSQAIYTVLFNRIDTGGNYFAEQLLNSYVSLVHQPDQLEAISQRLQLDKSGEFLMEYVRLQAQPDTMNIVIQADYFDPAKAQELAATVGEQLNARVVEVNRNLEGEDRAIMQRVQSATPPVLAKPKTRTNVLAAVLLGGVLGLLLTFVLEYMDDTLKSPADVERYADLITIGTIPAGAHQVARAGRLRPLSASGLLANGTGRRSPRSDKEQL